MMWCSLSLGNLKKKLIEINQNRLNSWQKYYDGLKELEKRGFIELPKFQMDVYKMLICLYKK